MHPSLARTVFRLQENILRRPTFAYAKALERSQWLPREGIQELQLKRLRHLLNCALQHCPWHAERIRSAGIDPARMELQDLAKLPPMTREDVRHHLDDMVWRDAPGGVYRYNTGGSSGEPLIFYFGRKRQAADAACRIRARRWWGVEPGDREVLLWGAPTELQRTDRIKNLRDRLCNQLLLNAFEMSRDSMDTYLRILQDFQPKILYGYASSLALLAEHAQVRGIRPRLPDLKVVYTTGEPLYPHQREIIGTVFGAPVATEYGARDAGLIALESPQGQLLINSEWLLVEILDDAGNPVADGELGEVVVTNLASEAQPFIRYRTGDHARRSAERCRQGRGLEVLEEVVGRTTDFIVRPDGTIMHALALIYVLREIPGVCQFKIIQKDLNKIQVLVVPEPKLWKTANLTTIEQGLYQRLGEEIDIAIHIVEHIPVEKSGKYRYVVSEIQEHTLC
ncbi:MAG TPA: phenylacetate--CoA ligase family protein [Gammaproteobacteria bacterium]|nr:phenylacetate--CoA ligase family protein [Gammaproteobacteria bacterium]